jgi:hypothetical protein
MTNTSNDFAFDSVEPPVNTSIPRTRSISTPLRKKTTLAVSLEIHKKARFPTA